MDRCIGCRLVNKSPDCEFCRKVDTAANAGEPRIIMSDGIAELSVKSDIIANKDYAISELTAELDRLRASEAALMLVNSAKDAELAAADTELARLWAVRDAAAEMAAVASVIPLGADNFITRGYRKCLAQLKAELEVEG